ncbi:ADP-ribosyltransferase [Yersinia sp. J1]|uniref:ADP-ribosyltransferase n=1 Tax=Yersinia sp. J1 TaxID=3424774 RepID=UPI003D3612F3
MKLTITFSTLLFTTLALNISHGREAQPRWQSNKESWSNFQSRHCKWERGVPCKTVPKDQGKAPPKTDEEIAFEISLGVLSMGPTPQPRGFKVSFGAKPGATMAAKPRVSIARPGSQIGVNPERTPLLPAASKPKPKISDRLQRVNGKVGFLFGDTHPPTLSDEPPPKIPRIKPPDNSNSSSTDSASSSSYDSSTSVDAYDVEGNLMMDKNRIDQMAPITPNDTSTIKEELEVIYGKTKLDECNLNIDDEIQRYNSNFSHEKINFREYFAIRNFQEDRFVAINNALRNGTTNDGLETEITEVYTALDNHSDINVSLRESGYIISEEESSVSEVYRGEVRDRAEFLSKVIPEETIQIDTFLSTTADEELIDQFNSQELEEGKINVRYTIKYFLERTNSTDISELLDEPGEERIFLPKSRFLVTNIEESADGSSFKVDMLALTDEPLPPVPQVN